MDQFRSELKALLLRFPSVKSVKVMMEEEITAQGNVTPSLGGSPLKVTSTTLPKMNETEALLASFAAKPGVVLKTDEQ